MRVYAHDEHGEVMIRRSGTRWLLYLECDGRDCDNILEVPVPEDNEWVSLGSTDSRETTDLCPECRGKEQT